MTQADKEARKLQLEEEIGSLNRQWEALSYALFLTNKKKDNACDMVEVEGNIYHEDWKREATRLQRYCNSLVETIKLVEDRLITLNREYEQLINE